jgi:hypothetical protein
VAPLRRSNQVLVPAAVATLLAALRADPSARSAGTSPLALLAPGSAGPSAAALREDFPGIELPEAVGYDGQQTYAIARRPFDPAGAARDLDRPAYRLRRIGLPLAAWALHPSGGGLGLVWALFAVGTAGVLAAGVAAGRLAQRLGGAGPAAAVLVALAPGIVLGLRLTTTEPLAIALGIGSLLALVERRLVVGAGLALLAALTKEVLLLVLLGWALSRRDRSAVAVVAGVLLPWAGWALLVAHLAGGGSRSVGEVRELDLPLVGLADAVRGWVGGSHQLLAIAAVLLAVGLAVLAVVRHPSVTDPLSCVVGVHLAFLALLAVDPLQDDLGAPRVVAPLYAFAIVAVLRPRRAVSAR